MRYKVGDQVVIRDDLYEEWEYNRYDNIGAMNKLKGTICTIIDKKEHGYTLDGNIFTWTDEMIDHEKTKELNSKQIKTWEIMKLIDEDYEEVEDKEFKLKYNPSPNSNPMVKGMIVKVGETGFTGDRGLFYESMLYKELLGNEIWEEIKESVTFMEAVESGKRVRFYYDSRDYTDEYMHLDQLMEYMGKIYTDTGIRNFIKDAIWYIE